jgi:hypothetical protein
MNLRPKLYINLDQLKNHFTTYHHQVVDIDVCYTTIVHRWWYRRRWELILKAATRHPSNRITYLFYMRYVRHVHVSVPCNTINQLTVFIFILFFRLCVMSTMETIFIRQNNFNPQPHSLPSWERLSLYFIHALFPVGNRIIM